MPQKAASLTEPRSFMVFGPPKIGKDQSVDEPVLTDKGWERIGNITPGDRVYGTDGRLHNVKAVRPQGVRPVYRVTCDDGTSTLAGPDHLWIFSRTARKVARGPMTTLEVQAALNVSGARLILPPIAAIEWSAPSQPLIDPYSLGLLIGDGGLHQGSIIFTNADDKLHAHIAGATNSVRVSVATKANSIVSRFVRGPLLSNIRALGLDVLSIHKFIPASYKMTSVQDRFDLLRGLLDTDGSVEGGGTITFNTSSSQLRDDVLEMVRSLGGCARFKTHPTPTYEHKGEVRIGQPGYRIAARFPDHLGQVFSVEHKRAAYDNGQKKRLPSKRIVAVDYETRVDTVCIEVDAVDNCYITRDYIVTHNSTLMASLSRVKGYGKMAVIDIDAGAAGYADTAPNVDVITIPYQDADAFTEVFNDLVGKYKDMYQAVGIDTMTTLQPWLLRRIAGKSLINGFMKQNKASWDNWGEVAELIMDIAWQMHYAPWCGLLLFHAKDEHDAISGVDKKKPALKGSARDSIGAVADVNLYLRPQNVETQDITDNGDPIIQTLRIARFGINEETPTGNRVRLPMGLSDQDGHLDMPEMFKYIRGEMNVDDAPALPEQQAPTNEDGEPPAE